MWTSPLLLPVYCYLTHRSSRWPKVRAEFIEQNPTCAACGNGNRKQLEAHHIEPFHVNPERELDKSNLITLCESGPGGMNCHFCIGHSGVAWSAWNPTVIETAAMLLEMRRNAKR